MECIIKFFLAKNIRFARERAWELTVKSRGKDSGFWQPYVEEFQQPPVVPRPNWRKGVKTWAASLFLQKLLLAPLHAYPIVGLLAAAWIKGLKTAKYLHKPYFAIKKMSEQQISLFVEERKWQYRVFGFVAALVESVPLLGLLFSISNRIGAAMWAHDLEKRQHMYSGWEPIANSMLSRTLAAEGSQISIHYPKGTEHTIDTNMLKRKTDARGLDDSWEELLESDVHSSHG